MNKTDLIAALSAEDFDRESLLEALTAEAARTEPFRTRPDVKVEIDRFNTARKDQFQPAIYKKDGDALAASLREMVAALYAVAETAGVSLDEPEVDEETEEQVEETESVTEEA